ncbi:hypothetical protein CPC16_004785 [Podila verticillata]|nr:hypothetical protein CPC16_004785 [Podila verticillata]
MTTLIDIPGREQYRRRFLRDGFVVIENVLQDQDVRILSREADNLMNFLMSEDVDIMQQLGGVIEPISSGYIETPLSQMFIFSKTAYSRLRNMVTEEPDSVTDILFSTMPQWAKVMLPDETDDDKLCLFNEQYIVKTPRSESVSSFGWHQDSQYMDASAQSSYPVVSCWTALDDISLSNGTLIIEPFPRPITEDNSGYIDVLTALTDMEEFIKYHQDISSFYETALDPAAALEIAQAVPPNEPLTNRPTAGYADHFDAKTWKNYERQAPVLVDIPAGSVVFLSGFVRHCSLGNASAKFRRAFMPQYSIGKVMNGEGGYISLAVPCSVKNEGAGDSVTGSSKADEI